MSATTIVKRFFFISVRFKAILVTLLACVLSTGAVLAQSKPDNSNDNEPARVEIPPAPRETNNGLQQIVSQTRLGGSLNLVRKYLKIYRCLFLSIYK